MLRVIVTGCIFAVFDAVIRLQALPAPTHLSAILTGQAPPMQDGHCHGHGGDGENKHQYYPALIDMTGKGHILNAISAPLVSSHPPLLTARARLIEYLRMLDQPSEGYEKLPLYEW